MAEKSDRERLKRPLCLPPNGERRIGSIVRKVTGAD